MAIHPSWFANVQLLALALVACSSNAASPTSSGNRSTAGATTAVSTGATGTGPASGAGVAAGSSGVGGGNYGGGASSDTGPGSGGAVGGMGGRGGMGVGGTGMGGTGNAGADIGGAGGSGSAGASDGGDPSVGGDQQPWRPLKITAPPGQHVHNVPGGAAGIDNRAVKMAGKLIVDLTFQPAGSYSSYLGKRGFHVYGLSFYLCPGIDDWSLGSSHNGDCRANTFDGLKHGNDAHEMPETSISGRLKAGLAALERQFPEEDWGYFLNQDGSVRWSDVGLTGESHAAQTAARIGHLVRLYRAVSQSGPRDDTCGTGAATSDYDPNKPPYDLGCTRCTSIPCPPGNHYSVWLDEPVVTPIDRFYSFVGKLDVQYGDDLFHTEHVHYVGVPVNISTAKAPYGGSHRFYANVGHVGFPNGFPMDAINIAFGVLPENLNPTF